MVFRSSIFGFEASESLPEFRVCGNATHASNESFSHAESVELVPVYSPVRATNLDLACGGQGTWILRAQAGAEW